MTMNSIAKESVEFDQDVFNAEFNESLVHQVVVAYLSSGRKGDKAQKTRSEVSGGGKKPWRQKGTGRARAGTIRSPIWVGGGRAFATRPGERNFEKKVNKKSYRLAMKSIVSELLRQDRLIITDEIVVDKISTKTLQSELQKLNFTSGLVVSEEVNSKLYLSCRNIKAVTAIAADCLDPVSLIQAEKVVVTLGALKRLEKRLIG